MEKGRPALPPRGKGVIQILKRPGIDDRDRILPRPAEIPSDTQSISLQDIEMLHQHLRVSTQIAIPIMQYRNNITFFNRELDAELPIQPSLTNPRICERYKFDYITLADELKPFIEIFPAFGDIVYNTIPCQIVSWLYASGDPIDRFNRLEDGRKMLDIELERILRRDFPIYFSNLIDFFEIEWIRDGGMFKDVPESSLYECVDRVMQLATDMQGSKRMWDLKLEAMAKRDQLMEAVQAGKFELRNKRGQLRKIAPKPKDLKNRVKIFDEEMVTKSIKEGIISRVSESEERSIKGFQIDGTGTAEEQSETTPAIGQQETPGDASEELQLLTPELIQELAVSIEVPEDAMSPRSGDTTEVGTDSNLDSMMSGGIYEDCSLISEQSSHNDILPDQTQKPSHQESSDRIMTDFEGERSCVTGSLESEEMGNPAVTPDKTGDQEVSNIAEKWTSLRKGKRKASLGEGERETRGLNIDEIVASIVVPDGAHEDEEVTQDTQCESGGMGDDVDGS
ncbi:hypothetical protein H072_8287 [Dactylellina haptotyla CBS 200.50]|uniref:Uncharacterized protein n=1 Tax=Dactylellina haptotyla (strain CBS 200.50) TaxID=1284197 RepID=S8AAA1_DACHA|nr:hypothetical protein H072_8287 [Dactylellina haptotyla CBS 200.50]